MIDVATRAEVFQEPEWTPSSEAKKIVKWLKTSGELRGGQKAKAIRLSDLNCIHYAGDNVFLCFGLDKNEEVLYEGRVYYKIPAATDYNRDPRPYILKRLEGLDEWSCSCQWNKKHGLTCAHILALKIDFKKKKFGRVRI